MTSLSFFAGMRATIGSLPRVDKAVGVVATQRTFDNRGRSAGSVPTEGNRNLFQDS